MNSATYMKRNQILRKAINPNSLALIVSVILYIIILLRDTAVLSVNPYLIVIICATAFIFASINNIVKILMFLLPFAGGVFLHTIAAIALVCIIFKIAYSGRVAKNLIPYLFIGIIMSLFNSITGGINESIRTIVVLAVYFSIISTLAFYSDRLEVESILKFFVIGTFLSFINVVYISLSSYSMDYIITYGVRFGSGIDSISAITSYDPNTMGLFSVVSITLVYLLNKGKHLSNIYSSILMILIGLLGALSISRTYVAVVAIVIIYIIIKNTSRRGIAGFLLFVTIFTLIYMAFLQDSMLFQYAGQQYEKRFSDETLSSIGGRSPIFNKYMDIYSSSIKLLLFGAGINGYKTYGSVSAHNGFQEIFLAWGIVGFILVTSWLLMLIKRFSKGRDKKLGLDLYIPLISFLIYIQTLQWFSIYIYILLFAVTLLALKVKRLE